MTKKVTPRWAQPHDAKSHLAFAVGAEFSQKLREALDRAGLTPSDLARRIWGDAAPTAKGYVSARNRDRISKYLAGKVIPDAATLKLLAKALRVPEESLAPQVVGNRLEREHPELRLTVIAGHRDRVHLTINSAMSLSKALGVIALINEKEDSEEAKLELRERVASDAELSASILKQALGSVNEKRGTRVNITPELLAMLRAEIDEAVARGREQTRKDRETIYEQGVQNGRRQARVQAKHHDEDTLTPL
jgi:transcriptional regulator with XRE-family HTH domain